MKFKLKLLVWIICFGYAYSSYLRSVSEELYNTATTLMNNDLSIYLISSAQYDERFLPEIGNGHIATQIKNKWIFVNGLYNGHTTTSHRACVPSLINWSIQTTDRLIQRIFTLDSLIGITREIFVYSRYNISITTYISRNFRQILIKNISLETNIWDESVTATTNGTNFDFSSPDIDFKVRKLGNIFLLKGQTKQPENTQMAPLPIYVVSESIPTEIFLNASHPWVSFVTSIDINMLETFEAFDKAMTDKPNILYSHAQSWIETWNNGLIQITKSSSFLVQSIHLSQYYILSSLPFQDWSKTDPSWAFYGLSPGGLAHGDGENDYMGHVFWDMDTWMYPSILPFHRNAAIEMVKYRLMMLKSAIQHSNSTGYRGARYPWESGRTGFETTPSKLCANNEIHITGDVSFAIQQLLWMEPNTNILLYNSFGKIIDNIARFWESRTSYNPKSKIYGILGVMPPDEYVYNCNNSAFTNMIARLALEAPIRLAQRFGRNVNRDMLRWFNLAQNIHFFVDPNRKIILEHDTYKLGTIVKQADVMLLCYPLQLDIEHDYIKNSQLYYENVTDSDGPAMTWTIYSINWFQLNNIIRAEELFERNYAYITQPFYVWSEQVNASGAINFQTGMGGYLQNIVNGFMGMRLKMEGRGQLIFSPSISTIIHGIHLHNVKFQGSGFSVKFDNKQISLELINNIPINVFASEDHANYSLNVSSRSVTLDVQEIVITSL